MEQHRPGLGELAPGAVGKGVDTVTDLARGLSIWPVPMGLACCAIEMMATAASRFDIARFGSEVFRATPRHADVMLVSGRVSHKMATILRNIYDEMADPKWVISMGACASSGGVFNNYAVVQGCDHVVPVDIYLPGCPPRPEMLSGGLLARRAHIKTDPLGKRREEAIRKAEAAALEAVNVNDMKGLMA